MPKETMHARISPSKIARILGCPASLTRSEDPRIPPDRPNPAAEEGTARHEEIAMYLEGVIADKDWSAFSSNNHGPSYFEDKTRAAWAMVVSLIQREVSLRGYSLAQGEMCPVWDEFFVAVGIEERVYADVARDIHGTPDFWFIARGPSGWCLHVCDFKFGYTPVAAERNAQLMTYAKGVLEGRRESLEGDNTPEFDYVTLHIIQPSFGDIKSWTTTVEGIDNWWAEIAGPGIDQALAPNPGARPTNENCQWCRGKLYCPEYRAFADAVAQRVFAAAGQIESETITDDELFSIYDDIPTWKNYISLVESRVRRILAIGPSHGLKMVRANGKRSWVPDCDADVLAILDSYADQEIEAFKTTLVTAPALLKKYPFLKKNAELMALVHKAPGKTLKIVPEDDPAPAITDNPFAGLEDPEDEEMEE